MPRPLQLPQPGEKTAIGRMLIDRRVQRIDADVKDRADREHLFGAAMQPFLADTDDRNTAFAILYTG